MKRSLRLAMQSHKLVIQKRWQFVAGFGDGPAVNLQNYDAGVLLQPEVFGELSFSLRRLRLSVV
jgi:hypothetical protein